MSPARRSPRPPILDQVTQTASPAARRIRRHTKPAKAAPADPAVRSECGTIVRQAPLSRAEADELAVLLKAVADPVRLQLLSLIASAEAGEMCVCDLTVPVELSQPTVSHHLRVLSEAGIVTRERRASWVWYRIVAEAIDRIRTFL
jgi:ArsR family transcriptional regulator